MGIHEKELNLYYNQGQFNHPERIGYVMKLIRSLRPLTEAEWRAWYLTHVHDMVYIEQLAAEMCHTIPSELRISQDDCLEYILDVMFHRTFCGYDREKAALALLRERVCSDIREAPSVWDTRYFIDFFVHKRKCRMVGIQLKPASFYAGGYQDTVSITEKMERFQQKYDAFAYVLTYQESGQGTIQLDPAAIKEIQEHLDVTQSDKKNPVAQE